MKWGRKLLFKWWQQCKRHLVVTSIITMIILIILIFIGYEFDGTGFRGGNQVTTSRIISGQSKGTVTQTEVYQPGKTLWDWLQLLIVPVVLATGGAIITITTNRSEQTAAKQRDITERSIASDNQREATLQSYLDKMSELLLEKGLRNSKPDDEIRKVARVRTLTILSRLDKERKKNLLQFLYEAGLINQPEPIILLDGANLKNADLNIVDLSNVNLMGANLAEASIVIANLSGANLSGAIMNRADLSSTNLSGANLSGAILNGVDLRSTMLDGANLSGAILNGTNLSGAILRRANLSEATLMGANLSRANLSEAILNEAILTGANLSEATLKKEQLDKARDLTYINLSSDPSANP